MKSLKKKAIFQNKQVSSEEETSTVFYIDYSRE